MRNKNNISIGAALDAMVKELKLKPKLDEVRIREEWAKIPAFAKYTRQINLRGNKLYITIDNAALKQELSYSLDKIKDMLNRELGSEVITEVIIY